MFGNTYPSALRILHEDLYMDDIISGDENAEVSGAMCREVVDCLKLGGFTAHKACSNDPRVLREIAPELVNEKELTKVLGHLWDTKNDTLQFDLAEKFPDQSLLEQMSPITRRNVVSVGSTLFDTIGLVLPYQMQLRIVIPLLWANNITWDESLENRTYKDGKDIVVDEIAAEAVAVFRAYCKQIPLLQLIKVPRYLRDTSAVRRLAVFSDASRHAFGAVVYSIIQVDSKTFEANIEFSRARLAPKVLRQKLKDNHVLSIAMLELCGMVIAAKAAEFVCKT